MVKAVFTTKVSPVYNDLPERHYHFPKTYLKQVEAAVGDWIVYYEPRRTTGDVSSSGGRQTYFATRSEEHTSELQSLMRISYDVFCLKKKNTRLHSIATHFSTISNQRSHYVNYLL